MQGAFALNLKPNDNTWIANGNVRAIYTKGSVTYIGGDFTAVGPNTGRGAALDSTTASVDMRLPRVNNTISAAAPDGSGGWYIGGTFTIVGGVARNRIAHILSNGTLDTAWDPNANSTVSALAVSGSVVYAGGSFTNIGGQTRNYIAALSTTTGNATGWNPAANNTVVALAVYGTTIYAGGTFTTIGGQTRNRIGALSTATALATAWNPNANSTVSAIVVSPDGNTIFAGGAFTTFQGASGPYTRNYIGAIDATTFNATPFDANSSAAVAALAVSGDGTTLYAGGSFTTMNGGVATRNRIAALNTTTGLVTTWDGNANAAVSALALSADSSTVYAGGSFTTMGGVTRNYVAAMNNSTGAVTAWDGNANAAVTALAVGGTNIYAGGSFYSIGRYLRNRIAAIDVASGAATAWNPNAGSTVYALATSSDGSTVYAGGLFTTIGGATRNRIAALSASTGLATTWNPSVTNNQVNALAVSADNSIVYAGGTFTTITGASGGPYTRNRIAAINASTSNPTTWNPNASNAVNALRLSNDGATIYAGGSFATITGAGGGPYTRNDIAAVSTATGTPTTWNPNLNGAVNALALSVDGSTVYAGGAFTTVQGGSYTRNYIAAINASSANPTAWDGNANAAVSALAVNGNNVYAGGSFTNIGGQWRNYCAELDSTTAAASSFDPNPNAAVLSLVAGSRTYAGGSFTQVNWQDFAYFAEFQNPAPALTGMSPNTGNRGQTLTGVVISGSNFRNVAMTVQLQRGAEVINATNVTYVSATQVTADFAIPSGATVATNWSLFLQNNDDSKSSTLANAFAVQYPAPSVSGMSPNAGSRGQTLTGVTINGNYFRNVSMTVQLQRGSEVIPGTNVTYVSTNQVTADFTIPGAATVATNWSLYLQNNDDFKSSTLSNAFAVQYPAPSVSGMSPNTGNRGQTLTGVAINGSSFRNTAMMVQLQRGAEVITATNVTYVSQYQVTADFAIPSGATVATNWALFLQNNDDSKSSTLSNAFSVQYPAPSLSGMSPNTGNRGQTLTGVAISGSSFRNTAMTLQLQRGAEVINATNVTYVSTNQVTADFAIPSGATVATNWALFLQNNDDSKSSTLSNAFSVQYPAPSLSGMSPNTGNRGQTLTGVAISGSSFRNTAMTVQLQRGSEVIPGTNVTYVSTNQVTADFTIPAGATVATNWSLYLQNNDDSKSSTLSNAFSVQYPAPSVTGTSPNTGNRGQALTGVAISGSSFRNVSMTVQLQRGAEVITATNVTYVSQYQVTADFNIPAGATVATDWSLFLQNNDDSKSSTLSNAFSVQYPPPAVTGMSPNAGNRGQTLTGVLISGSSFRNTAMTVQLQRGAEVIAATGVSYVSATQVTADFAIPAGATVATDWSLFLRTNDNGKSSTLLNAFTVQYPAPGLTGMSPGTGSRGQTLTGVAINGSNFRNTAMTLQLQRGAEAIPASNVTYVSANQVTADFTVPAGATVATNWSLFLQNNDDSKSSSLPNAFSVQYAPPNVINMDPAEGNRGQTLAGVTINGTDFRDVSMTVRLQRSGEIISATNVTYVSPTRVTADFTIPAGATVATDWSLFLRNNDDSMSCTLSDAFAVQYPPPAVTGMSPNGGNRGETLTGVQISGTDFRNVSMTVQLQRGAEVINATNVTYVSATRVNADFSLPSDATVATNWSLYLQNNDDSKSSTLSNAFSVQYPPPIVTGITPATGQQGETLTGVQISGTDFRNVSMTVQLQLGADTIPASNITYVSANQVTADFSIPSGATVATNWSVFLQNNDDSKFSTLNNAFSVQYPPPSVYSVAPPSGNNDGVVHITNLAGAGFRVGAAVKLTLAGPLEIDATSVTVVSGNRITCDFDLTGAATGLWDVTVTNSDGKSDTLPGGFAVQHQGPTVTLIAPEYGINNGTVHVSDLEGTSFQTGATVTLRKPGLPDIDAYNVIVDSANHISCDFNLDGRAAGARDVVVLNDDGQWGMLEDGFSVQYPAPVLSGISPNTGDQGETLNNVWISGNDFRNVSMTLLLTRGGETITASNITYVSQNLLSADFTIPSAATVGTDWGLFLQNNDDSKFSTLNNAFSVEYPPPVVTTITPASGTNDGSVHISNLAGSGFRTGASVKLTLPGVPGQIDATGVTVVSGSRITCDFDLTDAPTGLWDVTVTNTDSKSATMGGFTVEYPAPTVTSINPWAANNDAPVDITDLAGSNFRAGATVKLRRSGVADIDASGVVVHSPGLITCIFDITGKQVGTWTVIVTNDDSKSGTLEDGFSIQYPPPVVGGVIPDTGNLGQLLSNVSITGSDFRNTSMIVRLQNGSESIDGTGVQWVSTNLVTADFYIPYTATVEPGWRVFLMNNDDGKSSALPDAFTTEYPPPAVTSITPSVGTNDGTVHIDQLLGADFRTGAAVKLTLPGTSDEIDATGVTVVSSSRMSCDFDLTGATVGSWDVTVTNTDHKSGTLGGAFAVRYHPPTVTSISPSQGSNNGTVSIDDLAGTFFRAGATVKLHKSGHPDVDATNVVVVSAERITCDFDLTGCSVGDWSVVVTNDDDKSGTLDDGFSVQWPSPVLTGLTPVSGAQGEVVHDAVVSGGEFRNTPTTIELQRGSDRIFGTNIRWVSSSEVLCDLPVDDAPVGPGWSLVYTHVDDSGSAVLDDAFTVNPAPARKPVVTGLDPQSGIAGNEVKVSGVNFGSTKGSSTVTFNGVPAADYLDWTDTAIDVIVPGGATTGPVCVTTTGGSSNHDKDYVVNTPSWYLAEGSTAWGFSTYITVMNPNNAALHAQFTYMLNNGATAQATVSLPPLSQVTVNPADTIGVADFSTKVDCVEGSTIAVDRTMSWTGPGAPSEEGTCSVGVTLPSKTWFMPEGCSDYGFETWLLVQNPGDEATNVTITYMLEGAGPKTVTRSVLPHARATYNIANDIGAANASIRVVSDGPVIAERATYRNNRREGQESIGATYPSQTFYLSEGTTAWGFTTYVLVQNPSESEAAVTLTYMTPGGPVAQEPITVPPLTRRTIRVNDHLPDTDFSTTVSSTVPIVAERSMYWSTNLGEACHDSIGLAQPHTEFYMPDGQTSATEQTYTLVQNPNSVSVDVDVIYYGANGSFDIVNRQTLAPYSRTTFNMADRLSNGRASILVRCTTPGMKVLAERSMYWNNKGAGTNTIGGYSD